MIVGKINDDKRATGANGDVTLGAVEKRLGRKWVRFQ
jgi:hypothetical protein